MIPGNCVHSGDPELPKPPTLNTSTLELVHLDYQTCQSNIWYNYALFIYAPSLLLSFQSLRTYLRNPEIPGVTGVIRLSSELFASDPIIATQDMLTISDDEEEGTAPFQAAGSSTSQSGLGSGYFGGYTVPSLRGSAPQSGAGAGWRASWIDSGAMTLAPARWDEQRQPEAPEHANKGTNQAPDGARPVTLRPQSPEAEGPAMKRRRLDARDSAPESPDGASHPHGSNPSSPIISRPETPGSGEPLMKKRKVDLNQDGQPRERAAGEDGGRAVDTPAQTPGNEPRKEKEC
ncbi:hypothetical protein C8F04DRAFT_1273782 [Mycena alexandri]|uniref:Uncharacterized protein n=1 Tax=Mycena alexandri TaxID=1745969 RepID=A0AAD6S5R6_9AGAR|nr:hypothetical protein C8F04DRAFT_1273782 [Mycena alexandri]